MGHLLLYLFETTLCLSVMFVVYIIFLRKETYFNFNRIYLAGILILSLIIPSVRISLNVDNLETIEKPFSNISKIRSYYTGLIFMTDPEINDSPYIEYIEAIFEDDNEIPASEINIIADSTNNIDISENSIEKVGTKRTNIALIITIAYLTGIILFVIRLFILLSGLYITIKRNRVIKHNKYRIVQLNGDTPPYSFFRYIFVNKDILEHKEFRQILTHELVHAKQRHSADLLLAHIITVFQWFNPVAWLLQRAIKANHEYIADSNVVKQGFELFDYQSLLLRQLISIRSVELVNNFNLLFIKKRIKMMTKDKSGLLARLKAIIIIPTVIATFILFANFTIKSPVTNLTNFSVNKESKLNGIWENINPKTFGCLISFNNNMLSVLESSNSAEVIELPVTIQNNRLIITNKGKKDDIRYQVSGNKLKIWWSSTEQCTYQKTDYKNSIPAIIPEKFKNIQLPKAKESRILSKAKYVYNIYAYNDKFYVENTKCSDSNLKQIIKNRVSEFNVLNRPYVTARIYADKSVKMQRIKILTKTLRELGLLKVAYAIDPDNNTSLLQSHAAAVVQLLPPVDADKIKKKEMATVGDKVFTINTNDNVNTQKGKLKRFMTNTPGYIINLKWSDNSNYNEYIKMTDMIYSVVFGFRNNYALNQYNTGYHKLPANMQKSVRKKFPFRLSQDNIDDK
ncbi:MAG: M56 family metallopeptidase [Bacteroidales bacterium]|nr:M56 family metallopeptidase [Bacteroidales bacterium]